MRPLPLATGRGQGTAVDVSIDSSRAAAHDGALFGITEGPVDELALFGEFDTAGLQLWNVCTARLLDRHRGDVSICLADLRFIDAAGMGAMIVLANALAERRHRMTLHAPLGNVRRAFTAAGLTHLISA